MSAYTATLTGSWLSLYLFLPCVTDVKKERDKFFKHLK